MQKLVTVIALALVVGLFWPGTAKASDAACCVDTVGDVNLDGFVDMTDAMILNGWLNCEDSNICMDAADWDGDADVDSDDGYALGMWADGGVGSPPSSCHSYSPCNTVINSQPGDTVVIPMMTLTLTVDVTSSCPLHYRWYKNDTLIMCGSNVWYTEVVEQWNGGVYYVEVLTVGDRVLTDSFTVTVVSADFTPESFDVCHPVSESISISAGANPPMAISVTINNTNPSVATYTGDETGGTLTTNSVGSGDLQAIWNSQVIGSMTFKSGSISTDAGTPEYMCLNGSMEVINVTVAPWGGFTYTNSDPGVVSVSQTPNTLELTPVGAGSATFDLMVQGDTEICESFTVEVKNLSESVDTVYMCLGNLIEYVAVTVEPDTINWTITNSNPGVVTATQVGDSIKLDNVGGGYATIDLYAAGGTINCGSFVVEVTNIVGITTTAQHVSMCSNSAVDTVGVTVTPSDTWSLTNSNPGVVTAVQIPGDRVELTPVGSGYAIIELYADGLPNSPCADFTVSVFDISVSGPDPDSVCLDSADTHTINILPAVNFDSVTVTSSNPGVVTATLSSATTIDMFGVSEGTATVHLAYGGDTCGSFTVEVVDCVKCLDVDDLELCADYIYSQGGDDYMLVGNVTIDSVLWFDDTVYINTSSGELTGDGEIEIRDIPLPGGGTATFVLWNGSIEATIEGDTLSDFVNPMVALAVGGLGIKIEDIVLIDDGIHVNGFIVLPSVLGVDAEINSLELTTTNGLQIGGYISYAGPLGVKALQIKDIWFSFNTATDEYAGGATMEIKQIVTIGGDFEIISGQLNRIGIFIEVSPGIAIDATGLMLSGGGGEVDHMVDDEPLLIGVFVDITGGPSIAGKDLIKFDSVGVTIQPSRYFGVSGNFLVFDIPVGHAAAAYEPPKFSLSFSIDYLGIVKGDFSASLNGTQVAGSATVTVGTPCDLPWWLDFMNCKRFGGAELDFNNSRMRGRVWIRIKLGWGIFHFHVNLEAAFKLEYSSSGVHLYLGTNYNKMIKIFKNTDKFGLYSEGFALPEYTENVLFMVKGEFGPAPPFRLIKPDSTVLDSTTIGIARMRGDSIALYIVQNPEAGLWTVEIPEDGGQPVEIAVLAENTRPAIAFDVPSGTQTTGDIHWYDHDPDDNAEIKLYFDSDNKDFDGVLINPTPISENDGTDAYTWDMLNVDPGDYYIYGVISDTNNAPYAVYAPGKIHIPNTLGPIAPTSLVPTLTDTSVHLTWPASPDPVLGYEILFTDDTSSITYDQHWTVGDTTDVEVRPVPPDTITGLGEVKLPTGRYYKFGIRCFDSLNNISDIGATTIVLLENASSNDPPMITKTGIPEFAQVDKLYSFTLVWSDVDGPGENIMLDSVPPGFIDAGESVIQWTPDSTQVGMYRIQIRLTDGAGGEDTLAYMLHVLEAGRSYGSVQWGSPIYGGTDDPGYIFLQDYDLDLSETEIDSVAVVVESDSDPGGGSAVWLKQTHPTSVDFIGTVEFSDVGGGPGVLFVSDSTNVRVFYADDYPDPHDYEDVAVWITAMPPTFICGDVNGTGNVNIFDITYIISYLYLNGPAPVPMEAADVNYDGAVNIFDITTIIAFLYLEGPDLICP